MQELFSVMDEDRKYKQQGYMDNGARDRRESNRGPRQKLPLDVTGPRLPRLVQSVAASRCFNCAATLPEGIDFSGVCPKCSAELHCCKQCAYFEPSTRFQCRKSIPERIAVKDKANSCELFSPRVTVARDVRPTASAGLPAMNGSRESTPAPRSANDARAAFDSLFKK
jgi:hypothetical protein